MYRVRLFFQDRNMPEKRSEQETWEGAKSMVSWFINTFAGVRACWIDDLGVGARYIFGPDGKQKFAFQQDSIREE